MKALIIVTLSLSLLAAGLAGYALLETGKIRSTMQDAAGIMKDYGIDVGLIK